MKNVTEFWMKSLKKSFLDSSWHSDAVWLLYSTGVSEWWLTNSSVELDLNEAVVAGTVDFQHFNAYEGRPDMVYGKLIPVLAEIRSPRCSAPLGQMLLVKNTPGEMKPNDTTENKDYLQQMKL